MDPHDLIISPEVRQYSIDAKQDAPNDTLVQSLSVEIKRIDGKWEIAQRIPNDWYEWLEVGDDQKYSSTHEITRIIQLISSSDMSLRLLESKRNELVETWQKFGNLFPAGEAKSLQAQNRVPTVSELFNAVVDSQVARATQKKGMSKRAKDQFFQFLGTMDDHSFLFKFIPAGDKYVSLVAGVVTTIVKVSPPAVVPQFCDNMKKQ